MKIYYTNDLGVKMTTDATLLKESIAIDAEGRIWQEYWNDRWKTCGYGRPAAKWSLDGALATKVDMD